MISKYLIRIADASTNETIMESESFVVSAGKGIGHNNALISGLNPLTEYRAQVYALNDVGWSSQSTLVFKTEEDVPSSPPLQVKGKTIGADVIEVTWRVSCLIAIPTLIINRST
jgi:hypothetical protein